MGNSAFWWYPAGHAAPVKIDLGRKISDLQLIEMREIYDAMPTSGSLHRVDFGGYRQVRIIIERISGTTQASLVRQLRSLETHLLAGGRVAFALDDGKAWGSWAVTIPMSGDTTLNTLGNCFGCYGGATLVAGDTVSIESPNPEMLREFRALTSESSGLITLSEAIQQTFSIDPVFIREQDFYPALSLLESHKTKPILTHDRRLNWTLDMSFVELPAELETLRDTAHSLGGANAWRDGGTIPLEQAASYVDNHGVF